MVRGASRSRVRSWFWFCWALPLQQPQLSVCVLTGVDVSGPDLEDKQEQALQKKPRPQAPEAPPTPLTPEAGGLTFCDITVMSHRAQEYGNASGGVPWKSRASLLDGVALSDWTREDDGAPWWRLPWGYTSGGGAGL